jgi:hypothetical protein
MNPLLIPVMFGSFVFFFLGIRLFRRARTKFQKLALAAAGSLAAIPAILFAVYYTGVFGEAIWFYSFRAMPGIELAACGVGLPAGLLHEFRIRSPRIRKQMSAGWIPLILLLCVTVPYLKQIFLRPDWNQFNDRWADNICLQSTDSSCGPASAATLLKYFGKSISEKRVAQESFTSRLGTENWYLIRTMRRHGLSARYSNEKPGNLHFSFPSIVGVRLGGENGIGHFITVLGKNGDRFIVGDPLHGRAQLTQAQLRNRYYFTGFSIFVAATSP